VAVHTYIAIEGVIGVGKTTLARAMQAEFGAQLLLEVFEANPFLSDFYADRAKYAFQTQIFFLLSRYQQHLIVPRLLEQSTIISDYTFAKDRLFAHLNLQGDELATYERLHAALAENIIAPDLVVYLYADTPVLMERIAVRDRAYERGMSLEYIESLVQAYGVFLADYGEAPVLTINTNALDIVRNAQDLAQVMQRIRSALGQGTHQPTLPQFGAQPAEVQEVALAATRRRLTDLQHWSRLSDAGAGVCASPYYHLMRFQEQVGALAGQLAQAWTLQETLQSQYGNREEALEAALRESQEHLQGSLVDCLTEILRLANGVGVDLEGAYLGRLRESSGAQETKAPGARPCSGQVRP
jgi:deoxyguanosine kinase